MKSVIFVLISTFILQGCCNLLTSKEGTYKLENKECLDQGGQYIKFGHGIFNYECIFEVIPLSTMEEEEHHETRIKECHAKGGQYVNLTNDEFAYDCLDMIAPKTASPSKKLN